MSALNGIVWPVMLDAAIKAALLLAATWAVTAGMRRSSASRRHLVWLLAVGLSALLPALAVSLPRWNLAVLPRATAIVTNDAHRTQSAGRARLPSSIASAPRPQDTFSASTNREPPAANKAPVTIAPIPSAPTGRHHIDRLSVVTLGWLIGALAVLSTGVLGRIALWRLKHDAVEVTDGPLARAVQNGCEHLRIRRSVRVLSSRHATMPMTWGILRPTVLLPAEAEGWPGDRLRAVALHELAHVKRWDCATQAVARLACALYWFNPLAWLAARRLRAERELACDDVVLGAAGLPPVDYAEHLLAIARSLRSGRLVSLAGVSMARPAGLKARMAAILDANASRSTVSRRATLLATSVAILLALPFAGLHLGARRAAAQTASTRPTSPAAGTLAFKLTDPGGKPVAGQPISVDSNGQKLKLTTGDDGGAAVPVPADPKGYLLITVRADGYARKRLEWFTDRTEPIPATYTMSLERGVTIGGTVVDDAGAPIGGAHVEQWVRRRPTGHPHERYLEPPTAETAADGTWMFEHAPPLEGGVEIGTWDYHHDSGDTYAMNQYPLADLTARKVRLTLPRGVPIEGTVVEADGKPIAGARVAFGDRAVSFCMPQQTTGPDGRFAYAAKPGHEVSLMISADGYAMELSQFTAPATPAPIKVTLARGQPLTGRVVTPDGKGIAGARISMGQWRGRRSLCGSATTGADGRFTWRDAPADEVLCDVAAPSDDYLYQMSVPLKAGNENLVHLRRSVHVNVSVVDDATGVPLSNYTLIRGLTFSGRADVHWERQKAQHGPHLGGKAEYTETTAYEGYAALIEAPGYVPAASRVIRPDEGRVALEFRLKHGEGVAVTVKHPDGRPAIRAQVVVGAYGHSAVIYNGESFSDDQGAVAGKTDAAGRFSFFPAKEDYRLVAFDGDGYAEVSPEALAKSTEVAMRPWGRVHGRLLVDGKPVAGETITMAPLLEEWRAVQHMFDAKTDRDGRFTFDHVKPQRLMIGQTISHQVENGMFQNRWLHTARVEVQPGQTVDVTLGAAGRPVVGHATVPEQFKGQPGWFFDVRDELTTHGNAPQAGAAVSDEARVEQSGWYRAENVPPGTYDLHLSIVRRLNDGDGESSFETLATGSAVVTVPAAADGKPDDPFYVPEITMRLRK